MGEERLAEISDRNRRLREVPFETHGPEAEHGAACIPCQLVRAIDDVTWLLGQVGEIGGTREEWAADGPGGWFQAPTGVRSEWSERFARGVVEGAAEQGVKVKLKRRLVGEWQDFEVADCG